MGSKEFEAEEAHSLQTCQWNAEARIEQGWSPEGTMLGVADLMPARGNSSKLVSEFQCATDSAYMHCCLVLAVESGKETRMAQW